MQSEQYSQMKQVCLCFDNRCPAGHHFTHSRPDATIRVFRSDMIEDNGTQMCEACADDAINSGLYYCESEDNN